MNEKQKEGLLKEALLAKLDSKGITLMTVNLGDDIYSDILKRTTFSSAKVILTAEDTERLDDKMSGVLTNKTAIVSTENDKYNISYIINETHIPELVASKQEAHRLFKADGLLNVGAVNHLYIFVDEKDTKVLEFLNETI